MKLRLYHHPDGARIAYREAGSGPPVALLHSAGLSYREFEPVVEQLTDRFRLVLPDLPLHGDSEDRPRHSYSPDWLADVIAGFPGETEQDAAATEALIDALPFTYLHVFPYSERPGAASGRLGERLPPGAIRARARELRERGEAKARAYRARRCGQRADGVMCGRGDGKVEVLTEDYLSIYLPTHEWNGRPRFEVTVR